jgi:hypothetical protein
MSFSKIFIKENITETLDTEDKIFSNEQNKDYSYFFKKKYKKFPEFLLETQIKISTGRGSEDYQLNNYKKKIKKKETIKSENSIETCANEKKQDKEENGTLSSSNINNSNLESTLLVNSTICSPNRENIRKKNKKNIGEGYDALKIFYMVKII